MVNVHLITFNGMSGTDIHFLPFILDLMSKLKDHEAKIINHFSLLMEPDLTRIVYEKKGIPLKELENKSMDYHIDYYLKYVKENIISSEGSKEFYLFLIGWSFGGDVAVNVATKLSSLIPNDHLNCFILDSSSDIMLNMKTFRTLISSVVESTQFIMSLEKNNPNKYKIFESLYEEYFFPKEIQKIFEKDEKIVKEMKEIETKYYGNKLTKEEKEKLKDEYMKILKTETKKSLINAINYYQKVVIKHYELPEKDPLINFLNTQMKYVSNIVVPNMNSTLGDSPNFNQKFKFFCLFIFSEDTHQKTKDINCMSIMESIEKIPNHFIIPNSDHYSILYNSEIRCKVIEKISSKIKEIFSK